MAWGNPGTLAGMPGPTLVGWAGDYYQTCYRSPSDSNCLENGSPAVGRRQRSRLEHRRATVRRSPLSATFQDRSPVLICQWAVAARASSVKSDYAVSSDGKAESDGLSSYNRLWDGIVALLEKHGGQRA